MERAESKSNSTNDNEAMTEILLQRRYTALPYTTPTSTHSNRLVKACDKTYNIKYPSSNAGQGSQCCPIGLSRHVGPSATPRKFPTILGTESHGRNSKEHNYPRSHDYIAS